MRILRKIKWFLQRGRRGWADCDLWSLDMYLSGWMPHAMRRLIKIKHAVPTEILMQFEFPDESGNFSKESIEKAIVRWSDTLEKIALGFEAANTLTNLDYNWKDDAEYERLKQLKRTGLTLFVEHYDSLWD